MNKLNSIFTLHKKLALIADAITKYKRRGSGSIAALEIVPTHFKQVQDCVDLCQRLIHTRTQMTASILPVMEKCTHTLAYSMFCTAPTQGIGGALWFGVIDDAD